MRRSKKNGEQGEQIRKDKKGTAKLELLHPQAKQPDKLYNDLARFPSENPYPVLRIHRDGTVLYANKASEPLLKARGSGMGQPAPAEWLRLVEEVLTTGQVAREEVKDNGRVFAFRAAPIAESGYVNFYGIDITEQKRTEEALRESEEKFKTLADEAFDSIVIHDGQRIIEVNKAFGRLWGYDSKKAAGLKIDNFFAPECWGDVKKRVQDGYDKPYEAVAIRKDGTRFMVEIAGRSIIYKDRKVRIATTRDITERKRAEEALRSSENKYRTLLENLPQKIFLKDRNSVYISCNENYAGDLKIKAPDIAGKTDYDFYPKELAEKYRADDKRIMEENKTEEFEEEYLQEGEKRWVHTVKTPVKGPHCNLIGILGIFWDITERKRAEQALKKSNQLLRDTGEMAKVGGWELDLSTKEVFCTEETCRIHGLEPGHKLSLEEALNFYAPESVPALEAVLKKAAETGEPYDLESLFIPSGSKDKIWVRSLGRAVYSGDKIVKLAGTFQNIDKYKRAEERLQEERNLLRTLIDHIPDGVYVKDKDSRFIICNKAVTGYWDSEGKGNIIGKTDFDLFEPARAQVFFDEEQKLMQTGKLLTNLERPITDKAGNIHYGLTTKVPLKDSRGNVTGIVGINRDITEHKKTEQKLLEYQKRLKRLASQLALAEERERRRIAGELHDNVSQSLALAKIKLDALRASITYQPLVEALKETCDSLEKAIQDTRSLTFDLSNPILYELGFEEAVAEWLREQVQEKHDIATEFQDDGQPKPLDDDVRVLLFRNVRELLINCIKHANAGKVRVGIRRTDESIEVTVEDNGVGFDTAEVRSLSGKRAEFGLLSVRESIEELGGSFEIES
jgi:PAS domain S-box-containing protein